MIKYILFFLKTYSFFHNVDDKYCVWVAARKSVAGSNIGGIKETQEMINYAAKHNIHPDIEIIPVDYVNTAMERLRKADVKYRFVIDIGKTMKPSS